MQGARVAGALVPSNLVELVRRLLASRETEHYFTGSDFFAIAFALAARPVLSVQSAADTLQQNGFRSAASRGALVQSMAAGARSDPTFLSYSQELFCLAGNADLSRRLVSAVQRPAGTAATGLREPTQSARRAAGAPVSGPPHGPLPRAAAKAARPPPAPARRPPAKPARTPAPPARPPPALPDLPPPPARVPAVVTFASFTAAHRLASAEQFEELIAFGTFAGVDPHRYQIETVRRVLRVFRGRALLADEVGLGKTVEALMILREYQLRGMVRRALVLVPPALVRQWVGELSDKAGIEPRTTEDLDFRDDPAAFWSAPGVTVASLATARLARHAPLVQASPWDLVIVDEAHHIKSRGTASFKLVDGIKNRFLLLLTATPIETDLEELYNLVTLLKPGQFATPAAFRARFVDPSDPLSLKNREKLRELLAEVMVRNTRADSGLSLPPRYVSTVVVDPLPEERALYEQTMTLLRAHAADSGARRLLSTLLLEAGSSPAAVRGTLDRVLAGTKREPALREGLSALAERAAGVSASRKGKALVDLARAHQERVLVFTRFRDTHAYIVDTLRNEGLTPLSFHGGMTAREKAAALDAFREGARVLVATDVGGEGQNLHHCRVLVNFDLPYNPMLIEQRIGRLHRMGQTQEVRVYNLCARGTAEERVLDLLDRRLQLFELVVGELDMVLGNLADDRDLEERIVALYAEARSEEDVDKGFEALAGELAAARGRYEQVKALDAALFGRDFEA
jgi:superfamily II DNA or RNA helicase